MIHLIGHQRNMLKETKEVKIADTRKKWLHENLQIRLKQQVEKQFNNSFSMNLITKQFSKFLSKMQFEKNVSAAKLSMQ